MKSTREDVEHILGEVDDFTLERIISVGATNAELHEAALAAIMDYEMGERISSPSSTRVDALCLIIEELLNCESSDAQISEEYPPGGRHDRSGQRRLD